ncbi:hypothetical protein C2G38_2212381 [Gigaspora rosea]|uniref:Uncharacterized protein n=1 Tax=Gigaspora rosea TaxID=44941 RepID=A0A397UET3_9GLOM|nr:hypothetical protein C2G38_2212381 [Gigaspora rosea]
MSAENAQSVEKIASEVQQEVQQEDGLEFAHQPFINYEERIRSLESSIQTSNNQINCLETSVQTSNNENKNLKEIVVYIWWTQNVHRINIQLLSEQVEVEIKKNFFNNHLELVQKQFLEFIESVKYKN